MLFEWISRWWHKKGFSIQSPFVYSFIRDVISCNIPYYAYDELLSVRRKQKAGCSRRDKLLFRLANFHHPSIIVASGNRSDLTQRYLAAGCSSARICSFSTVSSLVEILRENSGKKLIYINKVENYADRWAEIEALISDGTMIVAENIRGNKVGKSWWQSVVSHPKMTLTFDHGSIGIVILNANYNKQHYLI